MAVSNIAVNMVSYRWSCNHEQGWTLAQQIASTYASGGGGTDNVLFTQSYHGSGSNSYDTYRSGIVFDTSSIPAEATVSSAILNVYRKREWEPDGIAGYTKFYLLSSIGPDAGYYNQAYFYSPFGEYHANGQSDNVNQWYSPSFDPTQVGKGAGGLTRIGVRQYQDYAAGGAWHDNVTCQCYFAANNTGATAPYLTITWTTPPAVTTNTPSNLKPTSCTMNGNVTDVGSGTVSACGVCYSFSANPTVGDNLAAATPGAGAFAVNISTLTPGRTYHCRAYVVTENSTQYGADILFIAPSVGAALIGVM